MYGYCLGVIQTVTAGGRPAHPDPITARPNAYDIVKEMTVTVIVYMHATEV